MFEPSFPFQPIMMHSTAHFKRMLLSCQLLCVLLILTAETSAKSSLHVDSEPVCILDSVWKSAPVFTSMEDALAAKAAGFPVLRIDLSRTKLRIVPAELAQFAELKSLILDRTKIDALPEHLQSLKHLEYFSANGNNITEFPEVTLAWKELRHLSLADNLIDSIPLNIDVLNQLETLNLWSNLIAFFPASLGDLPQLTLLDLTINDMTAEEQYQLKTWLSSSTELLLSAPCRCEFDD